MGIIQELPEQLANRIAAGEVVERPASVVKELVENAIDAGATKVEVELEEAGIRLIKVRDNGHGFYEDDAARAFLRHATSKIRDEHDLFRIRTLGFRGEALASIASVSHVTLKSRRADEAGFEMTLHGGVVIEQTPTAANVGTEITVSQLFYNTPARLKYLKTSATELASITDTLNRIALSHPEVRLTAFHEDKELLRTNGNGDIKQVMLAIYGRQVAAQIVTASSKTNDYSLSAHLVRPEVTRSNKQYVTLILNGRSIKNFALTQSVLEGYHTLLPIGRYPIAVLEVNMDPMLIDVNVHPTKREVRLSKEKELCQLIRETVQLTLREQRLIPSVKPRQPSVPTEQSKLDFTVERSDTTVEPSAWNYPIPREPATSPSRWSPTPLVQETPVETVLPEEPGVEKAERRLPALDVIGQLHASYIVCGADDGMYIIDQHAAQERIKYELFYDQLGQPEKEYQLLLLPLTLEFTQQETLAIEEVAPLLKEAGLDLEAFGGNTFLVREIPTWYPQHDLEGTVRDLIEMAIRDRSIDIAKYREEASILMACKRSIKANHPLNLEMMRQLIRDLGETTSPYTCPHGRPILVKWSTYELEKLFKRVM
ncbi:MULTISPECIES: DNA mismatch repair endonuclease MutL [unclassified Exiguobacterium]|uniref:DNA mismatch repair endonuclease MutL n=1 Tax=unclassified Exiguobacterium TaxID=2644629 RepID=UPI0010409BFA|nr:MULTISPECIES: DNA mismatch repair endonuclease MutL [unclassified Exiguobacterium]TCI43593.1 DNA mismatch repair endonuclease MutL [Exiguobacterium sp. SH5S32]TCI52539.1 DNA mismatch repair endonuclease MutL [Exiguobacterium sp. SH1S4]TCI68848.1 DNA mismatch repair endonuclease MutL [Exiguobacterium sp. SH1S1]